MDEGKLILVSVFPGWIVGVSRTHSLDYQCWVMTPELMVLNDGESYGTSTEAMDAGRSLVEHSLNPVRKRDDAD
jgi:hypothetical protein